MQQARILKGITALVCIIFLASASLLKARIASPIRQRQVLKTGWLVKQLQGESHDIAALTVAAQRPDKTWLRTDMPNQVADVLLRYGRIPDPHVGKNAAACAWIWRQDWAYATTFATPVGVGPVWLRLMGVDTIATVYVNEQEVGRCNNMFRRYEFDVTDALAPSGGNAQCVRFHVLTDPARIAALARTKGHGLAQNHPPAVILVGYDYGVPGTLLEGKRNKRWLPLAYQDVAAAMQNMGLCAESEGLGACWVSGFDERAQAALPVWHGDWISALFVGFPDRPWLEPTAHSGRPIARRPLDDYLAEVDDA